MSLVRLIVQKRRSSASVMAHHAFQTGSDNTVRCPQIAQDGVEGGARDVSKIYA